MNSGAAQRDNRFRFRDAAPLRAKASELGLRLPWSDDVTALLEPTVIGDLRLPNRLVVHPMEGCDAAVDGGPGQQTIRRYERYAAGGAGLIWFEATAVVPEGRANPHQLHLHAGNVEAFAALIERAHRVGRETNGRTHDPIFVLQLTHSGRWSKPDGIPRPVIVHHHPDLDPVAGVDEDQPVIGDDALDRLQEEFLGAARLAARAGFHGVDIKSCHGYLGSELLAAHTREGRYGGSLANRTRFLLETTRRIRAEVPGLLVTSRMNVYDGLRYPYGFGIDREDDTVPDLEEPLAVLQQLAAAGCPFVNVSIGVPYWRPHLGRPFDRPVPGTAPSPEHPLAGVMRLVDIVGELQTAVPGLPLVGTGYSWLRHHFPHVAAGALAEGKVALVGVGRMAFAYPDFVRDLRERGALDFLKSCCACSGCTQLMRAGDAAGCVVRDQDVYRLPRRPRPDASS